MKEEITDEEFAYLNDYVKAIRETEKKAEKAEKILEEKTKIAAETKTAYEAAKKVRVQTEAELAIAQTNYDKLLAKAEKEEANKKPEKKPDKDNKTPHTGDQAQTGSLVTTGVISLAMVAAVLKSKFRKKEDEI